MRKSIPYFPLSIFQHHKQPRHHRLNGSFARRSFHPEKKKGFALLILFRTRKLNWLNYQRASHNDIDVDGDKERAGIMKPLLCHHRSALSHSDDTIESLLTPFVKLIRVYSTSLIIFHIFPTFVHCSSVNHNKMRVRESETTMANMYPLCVCRSTSPPQRGGRCSVLKIRWLWRWWWWREMRTEKSAHNGGKGSLLHVHQITVDK